MDVIFPPWLRISEISRRLVGNAGASSSPLTGATRTIDRSGDRWAVTYRTENAKDLDLAERAALQAFMGRVRNQNARIWLHDPSHVLRGSFPASELLTNPYFANGTTGWTTTNSEAASLSATDGILRSTLAQALAASTDYFRTASAVTVAQYAPHVLRAAIAAANTTLSNSKLTFRAGDGSAEVQGSNIPTLPGLHALAHMPFTTSVLASINANQLSAAHWAGQYVDAALISLSRCALVDNGPNALLYSDQIDNAAWNKGGISGVTANAATAPDGTTTADEIVENSSTGQRWVTQSSVRTSTAEDCVAYGFFKRGSGTRDVRLYVMAAGNDYAFSNFDLGAGTASAISYSGGAQTTNGRAFIKNMGNGWYFCAVVARLPATTALNIEFDMLNAGSNNYTGDGTSSIYAWRVGAARSGVPTRGAQTVATALASGTTQTGRGLYLKGLPVSTAGLARAGDWCQIGNQLFLITAPLDSDAAGLGYLEVSPNIRTPFADNEPVIFNKPMGKYLLAGDTMEFNTRAGMFSDFSFDLIEDIAAG